MVPIQFGETKEFTALIAGRHSFAHVDGVKLNDGVALWASLDGGSLE